MKRNQKRLLRIIISGVALLCIWLFFPKHTGIELVSYLAVYFLIGGEVLQKAFSNIREGQVFDENFLMCIATIGAFFVGEYIEGVAVMLFYQVGELFQSYAVNQSRQSISSLMDIRPDSANLLLENGKIDVVEPEYVEIGERIQIKPGERVPLDGRVIEGTTMMDTSALTGESVPRGIKAGEEVLSGCINQTGVIIVEVLKEFEDSTVNRILDLVENASSKKSQSENFITKFARYYTPIVVFLALALAVLPPIFLGNWSMWIHRALTFLVISCPCALVISVPLGFFGGIGGGSRLGILIKGSNYLEQLAQTETIVFDKTGTLTKGVFKVQTIHSVGIDEKELLKLVAHLESYSSHPIAQSLGEAYGKRIQQDEVKDVVELAGYGLKGNVFGSTLIVGNERLMLQENIELLPPEEVGTIIHVAINQQYAGYIVIADELKEDSQKAIQELQGKNHIQTIMLTGDTKAVGESVAKKLGMSGVYTQLLPEDKVNCLESIMEKRKGKEKLAFVGDGINDAPVLARADIGIAMGGLGSDAAIEAADIVIMTDEPSKITTAIQLSRKTLKIVKENIIFAIAVKIVFLILGALGITAMGGAVFADVGVTVIAILNAMRCLSVKEFE